MQSPSASLGLVSQNGTKIEPPRIDSNFATYIPSHQSFGTIFENTTGHFGPCSINDSLGKSALFQVSPYSITNSSESMIERAPVPWYHPNLNILTVH